MVTHFEEDMIKRSCKTLNIKENICSALINDFKFTTINAEAEFWLNEKGKDITDKRVEILVNKADNAMEETAEDIETEEENW